MGNTKITAVDYRVTWNGTEITRGKCLRTALETTAIQEIFKIWKTRHKDFTPSLPVPAHNLLQIVAEPFEALSRAEQEMRRRLNTPRNERGSDGIKRF